MMPYFPTYYQYPKQLSILKLIQTVIGNPMKINKTFSREIIDNISICLKKPTAQGTQASKLPRFAITRSSSSSTLQPVMTNKCQIHSQQETSATTEAAENSNPMMAEHGSSTGSLKRRVQTLHTQIDRLQKQIWENKQKGKNKCKNYQLELNRYEEITNDIKNYEKLMQCEQESKRQLHNNIAMVQEDYNSTLMNFQELLVQKQYCDEVLGHYQREYESEAALVLDSLRKLHCIALAKVEIANIQNEINNKQKALNEWKSEIGFDLQEKVTKNKITHLRIELMKAEGEANAYAETNKVLKIRQILCLHIKDYAEQNQMVLTAQQLNEQGMEVFVCKKGTCAEFEQAVLSYRGKDQSKYEAGVVQRYFSVLSRIEGNVNSPKRKLNTTIHKQYTENIGYLRRSTFHLQENIKSNQLALQAINEQIQIVFANESVAVIEHLRESKGRYELTEIKSALRKLKEEQRERIAKIREIYNTCKAQEGSPSCRDTHIAFMNRLAELQEAIKAQEAKMEGMAARQQQLRREKEQIENEINLIVGAWNEITVKKEELKNLYRVLTKINKSMRHTDRKLVLTDREVLLTSREMEKPQQTKKSEIIMPSTLMKETFKLRMNRKKENQSQNECKAANILLAKEIRCWGDIDELSKTRKTSTSLTMSAKILKAKQQSNRKMTKDPLTRLLLSKLTN